MEFNKVVDRSIQIRKCYHQLEKTIHHNEWTIEEDALAFLTDAGLVGRLTMSKQGRWPTDKDPTLELESKIAESMWWLIVLAQRMNIDIEKAMEHFLTQTEKKLID